MRPLFPSAPESVYRGGKLASFWQNPVVHPGQTRQQDSQADAGRDLGGISNETFFKGGGKLAQEGVKRSKLS